MDTGWTFTTPLSTHYVNTNVITTGLAVFVAGFSSIFTGLNFIVTIHRMRAPGMTWFRLPLFVWSHYAASILMVLGTPVLAITLVLVVLERDDRASASSIPPRAAIRSCSSTCSGSTRTRPSTS